MTDISNTTHALLADAGQIRTALQMMEHRELNRFSQEYIEWMLERTALNIVARCHELHDPNNRLEKDLAALATHNAHKPPMRIEAT